MRGGAAECDELSALFAVLARELGVAEVGLFWPTSNHTVAVWMPATVDGAAARIVVPTSQVFLSATETLGTEAFDPWTQRTIYRYGAKDLDRRASIAAERAAELLAAAERVIVTPASRLGVERLR